MEFSQSTWVAIAFVTFFILVGKKGFSVLINILDKRKELVENEIEEAKKLKEQAQDELNASLKKQKVIINEIEDILAEAKEAARKIKIDAEIKAAEIVKRKEEQAKQKINNAQIEAINNIKNISAELSVKSAKVYIQNELDSKIQKDLYSDSKQKLKEKL